MRASSPPDTILLISDLHLEPARPELNQAFLRFLDTTARKASALYILGDFFNVWIGDDDDTPLYMKIAQGLSVLAQKGTEVFLMHGNRDFLIGPAYARACSATLIPEPFVLHHLEKDYLLVHGDALCTDDDQYQAFRKQVRDPAWQAAFLARSLDERRAFAANARAQSISMGSNKAQDIMDVNQDAVVGLLETHDIDTLIHGHTHRPAVHSIETGKNPMTRIVLGDWGQSGWVVQLDAHGPALKEFAL